MTVCTYFSPNLLMYMLCFNRKQMKNIVSEWEAKLRQIIQYLLGNNIFCVKTTADICRTMRKEKLDLDSNTYLVTFKTFCYPSKVFENSFAILVWLAFLGPSYVFGVGCNNSLAVSRVDTYFMLRVAPLIAITLRSIVLYYNTLGQILYEVSLRFYFHQMISWDIYQ